MPTPPSDPRRTPWPLRLVAVAAGGALGTAVRIGVAELVGDQAFPWATLVVNVAGAALLGYLAVRMLHHADTGRVAFAGVGFLGALTTFSTFVAEADALPPGSSAVYVGLSLAAGLAAAHTGMALARAGSAR
ncbi:MAG: CrcB family protein [Acidimicrobiia bacterium]|nr:CrcB family protein [Acidimicrobiia bacterium]